MLTLLAFGDCLTQSASDGMLCLCLQILGAYLKYMTDTGVLLGGERNETERLMAKVIEFEQAIANVRW